MTMHDPDEAIRQDNQRRVIQRRRVAHHQRIDFSDLAKMKKEFYKPLSQPIRDSKSVMSGMYYWAWGYLPSKGKNVILGPYLVEDEANRYAFRAFGSNYEIVPLPTRDAGSASRMMKGRRIEFEQQMADQALETLRHKVRYRNEPGYNPEEDEAVR